ncbi:MAG: hypothetical protein HY516_01775 [Candidatus Aenigmarchaeota archaeon]|nr:hypothetical protein [Candidatus Aenigmarchaeota archaeon]
MPKRNGSRFVTGFMLGFIAALVVTLAWNFIAVNSYPKYAYMMPGMMNGMMGYGMYGQKSDCSRLDAAQLKEAGELFMENMMGREFDEKFEQGLSAETSDMMNLVMGRMYYRC